MPIEVPPSRLAQPRKIAAERADLPFQGEVKTAAIVNPENYG
jgi:hypothetical protein